MALTVEDGSGVAGADSYISVADAETYCTARGLTFATGTTDNKEAALRRATVALDAMYRTRFPGYRTNARSQVFEWPRQAAFDMEENVIASNEIPIEVKNAVCEMAVRELAEAGSMMPDLERGGHIQSLRAGSVGIEFGNNALATTTFQLIDGILASLLGPAPSRMSGVAVRG
jgi:hypothetical protein